MTAEFSQFATSFLGKSATPGTLNLVLSEPVSLNPSDRVAALPDGRSLWPISVNGSAALAYRWPTCPLHVIEIVSSYHLREHLDVSDGDTIKIHTTSDIKVPAWGLLAWHLLWSGRKELYYKSNFYPLVASILPWLRGSSSQHFPEIPQVSYVALGQKAAARVLGTGAS